MMLPMFTFFAARSALDDIGKIRIALILLIAGFSLPVLASSVLILSGRSVVMTIYWTGLERYAGVYNHTHMIAHEMFVFVMISTLYLLFTEDKGNKRSFFRYLIYFMGIFAVINIYKSYVRTVYIGLLTLAFFHLIGRRRYVLLATGLFIVLGMMAFSSSVQTIFFDVIDPFKGGQDIMGMGLGGMGSGRIGMWVDIIAKFFKLPFERYFLGGGVGVETLKSRSFFGASHNDFLSLLTSLGIIGLLLYLCILCSFFLDIVRSDLSRVFKYVFIGFLFGVSLMNFVSNSYISRFEMGQYFFLIMGMFYAFRDVTYDGTNVS